MRRIYVCHIYAIRALRHICEDLTYMLRELDTYDSFEKTYMGSFGMYASRNIYGRLGRLNILHICLKKLDIYEFSLHICTEIHGTLEPDTCHLCCQLAYMLRELDIYDYTGLSKSSPKNGNHTWRRVWGVIRGGETMSGNAPLRPCEYFS